MDNNSFENYEKKIKEEFENSTIFNSDFDTTEKKKVRKKRNSYNKQLCLLLVFLIAIGSSIFAIVKYWPVQNETETENIQNNSSYIELTSNANVKLEDMKNVDKNAISNVKKIVIQNSTDRFECVPYKTTQTDANGNESEAVYFKLKGVDSKIPIDSSLVTLFYEQVFSVSAVSKLDDEWTDKDCGLDKPEIIIKVTMADNSDFDIKIGDQAPNGNYYLKTSLKDGIYIVEPNVRDNFAVKLNSLVNKTLVYQLTENDSNSFYFLNGTLSAFDSISLKGNNFKQETKISYNNSSDEVMLYFVDEPVRTYADEEKIKTLLAPLSSGLDASEAYKLLPTSEDYEVYGVADPFLELNYTVDNKSYNIKLSKPNVVEDGYTACVVNDVPVIYAVANENVSFVNWDLNDLRYNLLYLRNIETIKSMKVSYSGNSYKYELNFDEVVSDVVGADGSSESTTENVLTVILNSKPIDSDNFRTMYQRLALVSATDYLGANTNTSKNPYISIEFELTNGTKDVITYTKYDTNYYLHQINGIGDELIQARTVELLKINFEKLRKGEEVVSPNNQQ